MILGKNEYRIRFNLVEFPAPRLLQVLSLDAAHLKGEWNGTILALTGKDSNNKIVIVSMVICDKETTRNYEFLLNNSKKNDLFAGYMNNAQTTFFTDCHRSFPGALASEVPLAQHRLCLQHILKNVRPPIGQVGGLCVECERFSLL